jgi:diguanylate cyclase (GGDEF)-like protein
MNDLKVEALISFIGSLAQLAACVLLVTLFLLLRRYARRRKYFVAWGQAWLAACLAMGALVVRYNILPHLDGTLPDDQSLSVRGIYFVYQFSKLLYCALLLAGTILYARGTKPRSLLPYAFAFLGIYTAFSLRMSNNLVQLVVWQSPLAALTFSVCAYMLIGLPSSRRSLGSRVTGSFFVLMAGLWTLYFFAFGYLGFVKGPRIGFFQQVVNFNTYFDLLLHMLLGYGMIVILMEDAKREVDDAHAELAVAHHHLLRASLYDSLTGCLNRRAFTEGVGLEVARAAFGSVVMIDTDNLKNVNDAYGHAAGDNLLRHLAEVLRNRLRASDKLYRWGGDEFLLVLPGGKAGDVMPRLEERLLRARAVTLDDGAGEVRLEVSIGAADYTSAEEIDAAIAAADAAMYAQKHRKKLDEAQLQSGADDATEPRGDGVMLG